MSAVDFERIKAQFGEEVSQEAFLSLTNSEVDELIARVRGFQDKGLLRRFYQQSNAMTMRSTPSFRLSSPEDHEMKFATEETVTTIPSSSAPSSALMADLGLQTAEKMNEKTSSEYFGNEVGELSTFYTTATPRDKATPGAEATAAVTADATEKLFRACKSGDFNIMSALLSSGVDKDATDKFKRTALCVASQHGHTSCVNALLQAGAQVNTRDCYEQTALIFASEAGHNACVKALIECEADLEVVNYCKKTSLVLAAQNGHAQCVSQLLLAGAKPSALALVWASTRGHVHCLNALLVNGSIHADAQAEDSKGWTPLMFASLNGHIDCVRALVEAGANVDHKANASSAPDQGGMSPTACTVAKTDEIKSYLACHAVVDEAMKETVLMRACERGDVAAVRVLINQRVNLDAKNANGSTALFYAAVANRALCLGLLIEAGANVNVRNSKYGCTALIVASENGHSDCVAILLSAGADVEVKSHTGATALSEAKTDEVKFVLRQAGAKDPPKDFDPSSWEAELMTACKENNVGAVQTLLTTADELTQKVSKDPVGEFTYTCVLSPKDAGWTPFKSYNKALAYAASHDSTASMKALILAGAVLDNADGRGWTALAYASYSGKAASVSSLLEAGASIDLASNAGETPLLLACDRGHIDCIVLLIEAGAAVDSFSSDHTTPLLAASQHGYVDCVKALLAAGAHADTENHRGETALLLACKKCHFDCVMALLAARASPETSNRRSGMTPLILASSFGHVDIVKALVAAGANCEAKTDMGETALIAACRMGRVSCAEILIEAKASVDARNQLGDTALILAAQCGSVGCIGSLVKAGADFDAQSTQGSTALIRAAAGDNLQIVRLLLKAGADANAIDSNGDKASSHARSEQIRELLQAAEAIPKDKDGGLIRACKEGAADKMKFLITVGAKIDAVDDRGNTSVMWSSLLGHIEVLEMLLILGADVNVQNLAGETALVGASKVGQTACVDLLIRAGAFIDTQREKEAPSALVLASAEGHIEVVDLLTSAGANLCSRNARGRTALHEASARGHLKVLWALVWAGAGLDEIDGDGATALILASARDHMDCVQALLAVGANVALKDSNGETALSSAKSVKMRSIFLSRATKDHHSLPPSAASSASVPTAITTEKSTVSSSQLHPPLPTEIPSSQDVTPDSVRDRSPNPEDPAPSQEMRGETNQKDVVTANVTADGDAREVDPSLVGIDSSGQCDASLLKASQKGDVEELRSLLAVAASSATYDINYVDTDGRTALILASREGHVACVEALIAAGASVDARKKDDGSTALYMASQNNHPGCVKALLQAGADFTLRKYPHGVTPLIIASYKGHRDCVKILLQHSRSDINACDICGSTALMDACWCGNFDCVVLLLAAGADTSCATKNPEAGSGKATCPIYKSFKSLPFSSQWKASKKPRIIWGKTALIMATQKNHVVCMKQLLCAGADVDLPDEEGFTPLMIACTNNYVDAVKLLLSAGVNLNAKSKSGMTALEAAYYFSNDECVKELYSAGAVSSYLLKSSIASTISLSATTEATNLMVAASIGDVALLNLILATEACSSSTDSAHRESDTLDIDNMIEKADPDGRTALILASREGHVACVEALIAAGASVDARKKDDGSTALYMASQNNHPGCVKALLQAGADPEAINAYKITPLFIASQRGNTEAVAILLEAGADPETKDGEGNTALITACYGKHLSCVSALLAAGADVNAVNSKGFAVIHYAATNELMTVLLRAGARNVARSTPQSLSPATGASTTSGNVGSSSVNSRPTDTHSPIRRDTTNTTNMKQQQGCSCVVS